MSEHTPGPWHLFQFGSVEFLDGHKESAWQVVHCHPHEGLPHQSDTTIVRNSVNEADARLIAAAPDLLAALEEIRERCRGTQTMRAIGELAYVAIAKAKGEA